MEKKYKERRKDKKIEATYVEIKFNIELVE
jgi:hypothetical protein